MTAVRWIAIVFTLLMAPQAALAQTMSFEQAAVILLNICGKDIDRHCRDVNLGAGRMRNCLQQKASAACKSDWARVAVAVEQRARARVAVLKICEADARRLCGMVQAGDAQLLDCMKTAERSVSAKCNQAITDAGYR